MKNMFSSAIREGRNPFEFEIYDFLSVNGIEAIKYQVYKSRVELQDNLKNYGADEKYVIKAISPKIIHKSDHKAVILNASKDSFIEIYDDFEERFSDLDFKGIMITEMLPDGIDMIIGSTYDNTFGNVMVFGIGGIFVEVMKDVTFAKPPINRSEAILMINSLKNKKLFSGTRGLPKVSNDTLSNFMIKISRIIFENENIIKELDINPFRYTKDGIYILDARVFLHDTL